MSPRDLKAYHFYDGEYIEFEFESGITVAGTNVTGMRNIQGDLIVIQFSECTIKYGDEYLSKPEWGTFDLAVGKEIVSAFSGPADDYSFYLINHKTTSTTFKPTYSEKEKELHKLYQSVRNIREGKDTDFSLEAVFDIITESHSQDWLLATEIYELVYDREPVFSAKLLAYLQALQLKKSKIKHLIESGIEIIHNKQNTAKLHSL